MNKLKGNIKFNLLLTVIALAVIFVGFFLPDNKVLLYSITGLFLILIWGNFFIQRREKK